MFLKYPKMITKLLFCLLLWYHNTEVTLTAKNDSLSDVTNERSWFWSVGKMKGQTWRWDQDDGCWTAWKWSMRGRSGAGFFFSADSKIGPYLQATVDRKQRSLQWTWRPAKEGRLSSACAEGVFNYTGSSGMFNLNIDGYTLRNIRSTKASSNTCSLKPGEKDPETDKKGSLEWAVDGRKTCETVSTSNTAEVDEFLIYVALAQHPSYIPALTSGRRSKRQAEEEGAVEGAEGAAEETTTVTTTTTTEEEEDYDDDGPEPSLLDSIIEMIISFFTSIISFFM